MADAVQQVVSGTWNLNGVNITVNGEAVGSVGSDETLGAVVTRFARGRGIQNADVLSNGRPLLPSQGNETLQALRVSELSIVTKDQRA